MDAAEIFIVCLAIVFFIIGIVILIGKGDWLIAGYNTASEEERKKVNIVRLRIVMAIICWLSTGFVLLIPYLT
ncbi:DUF3784 domain-containing protein [Prevotella merdae]|uniref:DUF3784 domain-containing protein n=1 Tax=Prevotella merdae TaxID=2079531 RepID=UPI0027E292A6|nr:DUF3784 domain-containing protein [uncultured Prevotella sp.]